MKYSSILIVILLIVATAILSGLHHNNNAPEKKKGQDYVIPSVGSIEVLNGCGKPGIAAETAEYLRDRGFDVKSVGNASKWNYPETIITSRKTDTGIAEKLSDALDNSKVVVLTSNKAYIDATVFVGKDYKEYLPVN